MERFGQYVQHQRRSIVALGEKIERCKILILRGGDGWLPPMAFASLPIQNILERLQMRIPIDIPLATWIRQLIKRDKVEQFYFTDEWKELREEVLEDFHHECQECLKKGRYTRAICVHHVNEVRHKPELALSKYYTDKEGKKQINLLPLCNQCHNIVHEKLAKHQKKNKFSNVERW